MGSVASGRRAALDVASGATSLLVEVVGLVTSMPSISVADGDGVLGSSNGGGVFRSSNGGGVVAAFTCSPSFGGSDEEGISLLLCSALLVEGLRGFGAKRLSR